MESNIDKQILNKANVWLTGNYDDETKLLVKEMLENNPNELIDAFYRDLEFGTGGLRGVMGVGTNRMNKYTVAMATQGLANYLKKSFNCPQIKVAIAHDSRNNSKYFAQITAEVLSGNGFIVYLFEDLRPTPELSYAVRELKCQSGIVLTASHNPKEYNGYKVYWDDGAQLVPPHDENVIKEVEKIKNIDEIKFKPIPENIIKIGKDIDEKYISDITKLSLNPDIVRKQNDLSIVYTPLHGTGITVVPGALKSFGFKNINIVDEQAVSDGNFPTLKSPNPEEPAALSMAIALANKINADVVMATDPDADRIGVAVKNDKNEFVLLNGNQTATVITYYLLNEWKKKGLIKGKEYIVKTIVTTELLKALADYYKVECFDVLTGFKYIAEVIRQNENLKTYIGGGEESYGYLPESFVRDKDAVSTCCMVAEIAAYAKQNGNTFYGLLLDIYKQFGLYFESLLSITKKGKAGLEEIQQMMVDFRNNPPKTINNKKVIRIKDYQTQTEKDIINNSQKPIELPTSNVLQFILDDETIISIRPSGTEPKIKFYFGVKMDFNSSMDFEQAENKLKEKIEQIKKSMGLI